MTDQSFPITPPTELVQHWLCSSDYLWGPLEQTSITITANRLQNIATRAAQWGADQELEACHCEVSFWGGKGMADRLQATRRPTPPSLKEQLLQKLEHIRDVADKYQDTQNAIDDLRETLEDLPND
jgi:hypothetical protein